MLLFEGVKPVLHTLTALGKEAGVNPGNYEKIHGLFEKNSPEVHRALLRHLGFSDDEIREFVKNLKK